MSLSQRRPSQRQDNLSLDGLESILEGGSDQLPVDPQPDVRGAAYGTSDRHSERFQDWTIEETMRSLGVSRGNVLRRMESGELCAYKVIRPYGGEWRVRPPNAEAETPPPAARVEKNAKAAQRQATVQISVALKREVFESRAKAELLSDLLKEAQARLDGASMLIGCQRAQIEQQKARLAENESLRADVAALFAEIGDWMNLCWERDKQIIDLESEIDLWMNRLWQSDVRLVQTERTWWYRLAKRLNLVQ